MKDNLPTVIAYLLMVLFWANVGIQTGQQFSFDSGLIIGGITLLLFYK